MPRNLFQKRLPKAFPNHRDPRAYSVDPIGFEESVKELMEVPSAAEALAPTPYPDWPVKRFYRKHRAQTNDPICILAVIECMLRTTRGVYVRVDYLAGPLENDFPQYDWDNYVVGRMMAALQTACMEDYDNQFDRVDAPIGRGRDGRSSYYVVDPHGGNEGLGWLLNARKRAMAMSLDLMKRERRGGGQFGSWFTEHRTSNQPADLYTQWFAGCACRKPEFYKANWTNEKFIPAVPISEFDKHDPFA
jgi:hypothetical protein